MGEIDKVDPVAVKCLDKIVNEFQVAEGRFVWVTKDGHINIALGMAWPANLRSMEEDES